MRETNPTARADRDTEGAEPKRADYPNCRPSVARFHYATLDTNGRLPDVVSVDIHSREQSLPTGPASAVSECARARR